MPVKKPKQCLICGGEIPTQYSYYCTLHNDTQREMSGGLAIVLAKDSSPEFTDSFKQSLNERERFILNERFLSKLPLKEVGKRLNISRERVRQLEYNIAKKYVNRSLVN